jgi:succinate-semialdehyde dehydrogenase/glutarate-semialdehyde dehydrogenase
LLINRFVEHREAVGDGREVDRRGDADRLLGHDDALVGGVRRDRVAIDAFALLAMITCKCGPALAAGCTMVLKPATATPYSALALCELAERAGVPKGVFSCVTGGSKEIGGEMTSNPIVRKLTFTGSTEVGKLLMEQCAGTVKKLSLELGGNAPFIVFDDADIEAAVKGAIASKYRNAGQTCVCANRILVQDGVYDAFTKRLPETAGAMKVADGHEPSTTT